MSPILALIIQTFVQHGDDVNEIPAVIVGKTEVDRVEKERTDYMTAVLAHASARRWG